MASSSSSSYSSSLEDPSDKTTQFSPKVRKTYTIKKQREKWTEQEHNKFIQALKLHGRAWRHIEEHVGTKTAIQIRSHAQKFFSKLLRDSTDVSIVIPPPRPKKKPSHPYPRKPLPPTTQDRHPISSVSDQEHQHQHQHQSPTTSVLSEPANPTSPITYSSSPSSPKPTTSPTRTLKLLGTTVLVQISDADETFTSNPSSINYYILIPNSNSNQTEPPFQIHRPVALRKIPAVDVHNPDGDPSKEVVSQSNRMLEKRRRRSSCKYEEKGFIPYKRGRVI